MKTKCFWRESHNATVFLHPPKKAFLSFSVWPRKECTWTLNWKRSLLICFENCQGFSYSHRQSRNRMINTFIVAHIAPHLKHSLEDKSILVLSKKAFLLPSVCPGTEHTWIFIWEKSLLISFESYQGVPYSHTSKVERRWWETTFQQTDKNFW